MRLGRIVLLVTVLLSATLAMAAEKDPYLWLEEVDGAKALEWVKATSAAIVTQRLPIQNPINARMAIGISIILTRMLTYRLLLRSANCPA